jgi:hypothetical protein
MAADLITTHTHREPGYPNSQNFRVTKEKHARTHMPVLSTIRRIGRHRSISHAFIFVVFNRNRVRMVRHFTSKFYFVKGELEQKFYDHFFSNDYELDLVDLVSLRQGKDESVNEYIRRFWDTRNRCF